MGSGSDYVTPTFADNIYNKTMQKRGWDLPSLFAKPCIAEQAGGALAAISHIDFTYHCKIGSQFFREWRTAHTPLRPLLRLGDWNFGQGHDHELRNPLATSLAWSQRGRGQVPLRCRMHAYLANKE